MIRPTPQIGQDAQEPVADLISVSLQNNWDFGIGPADAMRFTPTFSRSFRFADHRLESYRLMPNRRLYAAVALFVPARPADTQAMDEASHQRAHIG